MKRLLKITAMALLMVSLAGSYAWGDLNALESVFGSGKIGASNDYWLEKQSAFQPERWDRVAVVFGMDDQKACNAITKALYSAYQESWRCAPAN